MEIRNNQEEINPENYWVFVENDLGDGHHFTTNLVWRKSVDIDPETSDLKTAPFKFVDFKLEKFDEDYSELILELENLGTPQHYRLRKNNMIKCFLADLGIQNTKQLGSLRGSYIEGYFHTKNKLVGISAYNPVQDLKNYHGIETVQEGDETINYIDLESKIDEKLENLFGDD